MEDEMEEIQAGLDEYYDEIEDTKFNAYLEEEYYEGLDDPYSGAEYDDLYIDEEINAGSFRKTAKIGDVNTIADLYQPLDETGFTVLCEINRDYDYKIYKANYSQLTRYLPSVNSKFTNIVVFSMNRYTSGLTFFDYNITETRLIEEIVYFKKCMNVE